MFCFVFSCYSDGVHLFAATAFVPFIMAVQWMPLTIPCRVTNPIIPVTLSRGSLMVNQTDGLFYHPKKGFYVASVTSIFNGQFSCHASMDGQTERKDFTLMFRRTFK